MMIKTIKLKDGCTLEIHPDEDVESPRSWDNIGQMVCFHKNLNLGDEHELKHDDYNSWDEMENVIEASNDVAVILPLYLMNHSGLAIQTTPFGCRWDSGQIGFIFCTKAMAESTFGGTNTLKTEIRRKTRQCLIGEVETYDQYLRGDVYRFVLRGPPYEHCDGKGPNLNSCWGFYGDNPSENGMRDHLDKKYWKELES
ncbi:hypothetical protein LCGC14_0142770 [marine sediment metagenome]|uniref:Uncharacterized protein n=1 Tax=marine sediment metagenome TaxID=412755 RepID=A0A0F9VGR5_9ZZZZ